MKLQRIMMTAALAALCVATLAAAPQSDKQPIISKTGRYGDPNSVARKYQGYLFGIVKDVNANEIVLSKTKYGVDHPFKVTKKTKFTMDGKPSTFDKFKAGDGVYVEVDKDRRTGDDIAKKVAGGVDMPTVAPGE